MNIAILITSLSGGGAERVASIVGGYYSDRGHQVYYFLGDSKLKIQYDVKGEIINTGILNSFSNVAVGSVSLVKSAHIMRRYKKKYQIDVAFSFMKEFNFINILSRRSERIICSECTIPSLRPELTSLLYKRYMTCLLYNMADRIIVKSAYSARELVEICGVRQSKLVKIPNPVILDRTSYTNQEWIYGDHTVICVGRHMEVKQQDIAIKAFSRTVEQVEDAKMIICGEGPQKQYLEKLIKALHLQDKVYLLGFQRDITYYYEHAKVFLLTSSNESFGNVILEAMAEGLPVISLNSPGGPPEILGCKKKMLSTVEYAEYGIVTPLLHSHNGMRATRQERELGDIIAEVLVDNSLRSHYAKMSKKRVKHYDYEKIMKKWDELIGEG